MISMICRRCEGYNIRRNGHTKSGRQKYHCKDCNFYGTLNLKKEELEEKSKLIEKLYQENLSQRGIVRVTGVSRPTVARILKKSLVNSKSKDKTLVKS